MNAPEVSLYPDSAKILAATRPPGGEGEGLFESFRRSDARDYFEGESPPDPE